MDPPAALHTTMILAVWTSAVVNEVHHYTDTVCACVVLKQLPACDLAAGSSPPCLTPSAPREPTFSTPATTPPAQHARGTYGQPKTIDGPGGHLGQCSGRQAIMIWAIAVDNGCEHDADLLRYTPAPSPVQYHTAASQARTSTRRRENGTTSSVSASSSLTVDREL